MTSAHTAVRFVLALALPMSQCWPSCFILKKTFPRRKYVPLTTQLVLFPLMSIRISQFISLKFWNDQFSASFYAQREEIFPVALTRDFSFFQLISSKQLSNLVYFRIPLSRCFQFLVCSKGSKPLFVNLPSLSMSEDLRVCLMSDILLVFLYSYIKSVIHSINVLSFAGI